jgi:hypothetical protein
MKLFNWNTDKNELLKSGRGISFENIVYHITHGDLLDTIVHPNQGRYPGQKIFIVNVDGYVCVVPFVEDSEEYFLKTVIPSRKMTRKYLGD